METTSSGWRWQLLGDACWMVFACGDVECWTVYVSTGNVFKWSGFLPTLTQVNPPTNLDIFRTKQTR